MKKIKETIESLKRFYYRKYALKKIKQNVFKDIAVSRVTIDWVTACIIERKQENRRKELIEEQAKLKENELFYKWLLTQS